MAFINGSLSALIVAALLVPSAPTWANLAHMRVFAGGGVVAPGHPHESIRMDSEEVTIRLKRGTYVVEAVFHFFNADETTTEWIGFPIWLPQVREAYRDMGFLRSRLGPVQFEGWVNGDKIRFRSMSEVPKEESTFWQRPSRQKKLLGDKPAKDDLRWDVAQVTFPGHSETIIRVRHEGSYTLGRSDACFFIGTGCLWKGNIGKAVIIVDSSELGGQTQVWTEFTHGSGEWRISRGAGSTPSPFASVLKYELKDFKPHPEAMFHVKLLRVKFKHQETKSAPPPPLPCKVKK